jgi:hypothetical protein
MLAGKAMAYDIAVANDDKVTIYYNYINDTRELEVTYKVRGEGYLNNPPSLPEGFDSGYNGQTVLNIPDEVTYMGRTRKVTAIGDFAIYHSEGLEKVTFGPSITRVGVGAMALCPDLKTVEGFEYAYELERYIFEQDKKLEDVKLSEKLTSVPPGLFGVCQSLKQIIIPASVKSIEIRAFCYTALERVDLPEGLEKIGSSAFRDCAVLSEVTFPSTLKEIGYEAFLQCYSLKDVVIPEQVKELPYRCFFSCSSMTSIKLPEGLTTIKSGVFAQSGLTSIKLPSTLEKLGEGAFTNCTHLASVELPEGLTTLEPLTFQYNYALKDISIPSSVKTIGACCFQSCTVLEKLILPEGLEEIGSSAFGQCIGMTDVTFNGPVTIGTLAFNDCISLVNVTSYTRKPVAFVGLERDDPAFTKDIFYNATLRIPHGSTSVYKGTNGWKDFVWMEEMEGILGDLDYNDEVNTTDVTILYNVIFGTDTTTPKAECNIDGSEDPEPNTTDVTALYNIIFGTAE